ncbi:hypothetical protein D3C84_959640 [compost metagenome]
MELDVKEKLLVRLLYLLEKIGLIKHTVYSNVAYYYDSADGERRIRFGVTHSGRVKDGPAIKMSLRQSYLLEEKDEASKKRRLALLQINRIKEEGAK